MGRPWRTPPHKKATTGETIVPSIMHKPTRVHTKVGGKILPCIGYTQKPFNRPSEWDLPVWFINLVQLITSEQKLLNHTSFHPASKEKKPISVSSIQKQSSMQASTHVLKCEHTHTKYNWPENQCVTKLTINKTQQISPVGTQKTHCLLAFYLSFFGCVVFNYYSTKKQFCKYTQKE